MLNLLTKSMGNRFLQIVILLPLVVGGLLFFNATTLLLISDLPQKAEVIICLNGNLKRIPKVAELYSQGYARKILVTYPSTRKAMIKAGIPETAVVSLDGGYNSTYEEALGVVRFMELENLRSAVIVSDPYHMYRARWTYSWLSDTGKVQLTYVAAEESGERPFWWDDTKDRRTVLRELPKIAYYWIAHGLLGIRYDPPWVMAAERWYNRMLLRFV
jgi:hypothetical protein